MLPETMLEYLTLITYLDHNAIASWDNVYNMKDIEVWYSNGEMRMISLKKVKERLTELEKLIIKPYVIDNPA